MPHSTVTADKRIHHKVLRSHLLALAFFALAALAVTFPLATHFTSHVTGNAIDDPALAWNLWWVKYRLVDLLNPDIFHVDWMFHPVAINLAFYTLTPLNGLLSVPLQLSLGLVAANNLLLLLSFILSAYGAWLLARALLWAPMRLDSPGSASTHQTFAYAAACYLAACIYAFAAPKLFYASLGQYNIASSQWIPFCVLFIVRLGTARTLSTAVRAGALAGLFLVFQAWAELTYASFLLIFFALAALDALLHAGRTRAGFGRLCAGWAAAAIVFLVGMTPILWAMLPDLRSEGDFFASAADSASGGGFADLFSADLAGYLLPSRHHPLAGEWVASLPLQSEFGQQIFLGYSVALLALLGSLWLWRRQRAQALFWTLTALFFWLLTLGPHLRWMGADTPLPGPFALISQLPFFSANRYPSRYGVLLLLCVALLAGAGMIALLQWTRRFALLRRRPSMVVAGVALLVAFEHASGAMPLTDFRIPPVYATLARQPGDRAVLELPTGWRNGARVLGKSHELIMMQQWYQTEHAKRRLGGNTSRNPQQKFQFFSDHPLLGDLIALMNADQEYMRSAVDGALDAMIARHAPTAAQALADLGIGWVTLDEARATPQLIRFVEEALPLTLVESWQGNDWTGAPTVIRLYAVTPPDAPETRIIDLAAPTGSAFLASGWSSLSGGSLRFATRPRAEILLPLAPGDTLGFSGTGEATILLNAEHLAYTAGDDFSITVPAGSATEPVDTLTIDFGGRGTPVQTLAQAPAPIGTTGLALDAGVSLAVRSAAEQVGNFAHIWLNGVDYAAEGRGYLLVALSPDGTYLQHATFDTFASEEASARMADFVRGLPAGTVVAGAIADEATMRLTQEAVEALRSLGVATDLRGHFRWSHAFIGVAGAAPGSALEEAGILRPAGVWLGAPVDASAVYGALQGITLTPAE